MQRIVRLRSVLSTPQRVLPALNRVRSNRLSRNIHVSSFSRAETQAVSASSAEQGLARSTPKVDKLLDDIVHLNVLETVELVQKLQKQLGPLAGQSMMMGMAAMPAQAAAPAAAAPAAAAAGADKKKPDAKQTFTVTLAKLDATKKIAVVKEVRALTGLGIAEAKALVESAPKLLKKDMKKEDAEKMVAQLKAAGAECTLE